MADCSNCEKKKAAAPELTSEEQTFLLALESKDARYHKLIRWIVSAFIFCMLMMSAIFFYAWTSYEYVGVDVDSGQSGMEHQTSQRSYRGMPYYYGNSGVEPGRDEVSYRRGRSRTTGRYVSRAGGSSYGDSEHITSTIEKMMQRVSGEEREVLEKCLDMAEQYS